MSHFDLKSGHFENSGGWTIAWQSGEDISGITGTTIPAGLQEIAGAGNVTFNETGNNLGDATKIVLVMGEIPYAEGMGDYGFASSIYFACPGCDNFRNKKMSIYLSDVPYHRNTCISNSVKESFIKKSDVFDVSGLSMTTRQKGCDIRAPTSSSGPGTIPSR